MIYVLYILFIGSNSKCFHIGPRVESSCKTPTYDIDLNVPEKFNFITDVIEPISNSKVSTLKFRDT